MRKNRIRLTESQLHNVIKESVRRVLYEGKMVNNGDVNFDYGTGKTILPHDVEMQKYDAIIRSLENNDRDAANRINKSMGDRSALKRHRDRENQRNLDRRNKQSTVFNREDILDMLKWRGLSLQDYKDMSPSERQKLMGWYQGEQQDKEWRVAFGGRGEGFDPLTDM